MSTGFQTAVAFSDGLNILFKMNKLSEDTILVILQYLEFARPDVPAKLVSDLKSTFDIQLAVKREKETSVHNEDTRSYFGLGHIRGFKYGRQIWRRKTGFAQMKLTISRRFQVVLLKMCLHSICRLTRLHSWGMKC